MDPPGHRVVVTDNDALHFGAQALEMRRLTRSPHDLRKFVKWFPVIPPSRVESFTLGVFKTRHFTELLTR